MTSSANAVRTRKLVYTAVLSALVIVFQLLAEFLPKIGEVSLTFVLPCIIVGVALCGKWTGAWLGGVFGATVLAMPSTYAFYGVNVFATILVCLLKGIMAGLLAGVVYDLLSKVNRYFAVFAAAFVSPVVNTGLFLLGGRLFFYELITEWSSLFNFESATAYMFLGLAGVNFLVELAINLVLSPAIVRIIDVLKKKRT